MIISDSTYLLWLDCSAYESDSEKLEELIREKTGLWLCAGKEYGGEPDGFLRVNIACPRSRVMDGLERLKRALLSCIEKLLMKLQQSEETVKAGKD